MEEQQVSLRHLSGAAEATKSSRATANALEAVNATACTEKNTATPSALGVGAVVSGEESHTRPTATAVANAPETTAVACAVDVGTGPLTRRGGQLKAPSESPRAANESSEAANQEQPLQVAALAAASPSEPETNEGNSSSTTYAFARREQLTPSSVRGTETVPANPIVTSMTSAHMDTPTLASVARIANSTLQGVREREAALFTSAAKTALARASEGFNQAAAHTVLEREAEQAPPPTSGSAATVGSNSSIMESQRHTQFPEYAAALPREARMWSHHEASGDEDEAEKKFQALSPSKGYLGSQQQREQIQKQTLAEEDQERQPQELHQEDCHKASLLPVFEAVSTDTTGQQFLQLSAISPSGELHPEAEIKEEGSSTQMSAGEVPVCLPAAAATEDVLPAFANEENRRLHAEIQRMRQGLLHTNTKVGERKERIQMLSEHLKHVLLELQQTNQIATAKRESIRTEEHMAALRQRHASQLQRHAKHLITKIDTYAEQLLSLNTEMVTNSARLDQFKLEMNWNAAELKQWRIAEQQKQQDRLQVEQLQRADERDVKQLTLDVEKLSTSTHKLTEKLYEQRTHARGLQVELESASLQFNGLQQERLHLIEQWEAALESMQQRDEAIQHAAARYSMAQEDIKQKLAHFHSMQRFTSEQIAANAKLQKRLQQLEKTTLKLREALAGAKSHLDRVNAKSEELRTQLSTATSAAAKTRKEIEHLQEVLEGRKQQLASLKRRSVLSQKRIETELHKATSEDEAFKNVEAFCRQLEQDCKAMQMKLKRGRQMLFEEAQQQVAQQAANQAIYSELNSSKAALRNLLTQLHRLDQDRQRQQELLYAVEFQSQVMQRKVARAAGYRGTAEKKQLTTKIEKLTQLLDQQNQQVQMLTTQLRRLESELRKAQRKQQVQQGEAWSLTDVLGNLRLECNSLRREATERQKEKESVYVEHDTLKLEVKKLQDQLRASHSAACSAEADKQQVQAHTEEEILKAENRLEVVRTATRVAYEEKHKLLLELASRKTKVLNLESKYSVLVQKMKTDTGEGVERSQAYYIIKASQEKQDLQRVGDELDQKLRDAEQESRSLQVTLQQLKERNQTFRKSLNAERHFVQHEKESRTNYEAILIELHDKIYEQEQLVQEFKREKNEEERRVNESLYHLSVLSEKLQRVGDSMEHLRREMSDQQEKLRRAEKQHRKVRQAARAKSLLPELVPHNYAEEACEETESSFCYDPRRQFNIEMEPHLEGLRGHMNFMLHSLAIVLHHGSATFPAAAVAVEEALAVQGLALPSRPVSVTNSSDGQSVNGSNRSSSRSVSRWGERNLSSSSRCSSAFSSGSFSYHREGPLLSIGGTSSSGLSASQQLLPNVSRSANSSVVSSAGGHSLRGYALKPKKMNAGRAATIELPLCGVASNTDCGTSPAGRFETMRKAASGPAGVLHKKTSGGESEGEYQCSNRRVWEEFLEGLQVAWHNEDYQEINSARRALPRICTELDQYLNLLTKAEVVL